MRHPCSPPSHHGDDQSSTCCYGTSSHIHFVSDRCTLTFSSPSRVLRCLVYENDYEWSAVLYVTLLIVGLLNVINFALCLWTYIATAHALTAWAEDEAFHPRLPNLNFQR